MHPEIEAEITKRVKLHAKAENRDVSQAEVDTAASEWVESLSKLSGAPKNEFLSRHVAGLIALAQQFSGKPFLAQREGPLGWICSSASFCHFQVASTMIKSMLSLNCLVGQSVIRLISFDPLLPSELIDRSRFEHMDKQMKAYNRLGVKAWKAFYASG